MGEKTHKARPVRRVRRQSAGCLWGCGSGVEVPGVVLAGRVPQGDYGRPRFEVPGVHPDL